MKKTEFTQPDRPGGHWNSTNLYDDDGHFLGVNIGSVKRDRRVCLISSTPDSEHNIDDLVLDAEDRANIRILKRTPQMYRLLKEIVRACPEIGTDIEVSGADVIDALNPYWVRIRKLIKFIEG